MLRRVLMSVVFMLCAGSLVYAGGMGTYAFPQKGQTPDQQNQDESGCAQWAADQTGINPAVLEYRQQEAQADLQKASAEASKPQLGRKLGRAALTGAALGEMDQHMDSGAGKGAAMGATLAASKMLGQKQEQKKQAPLNEANAQAGQVQAETEQYVRAYSACMEGKGYSIR
jgi:hypothetical protein